MHGNKKLYNWRIFLGCFPFLSIFNGEVSVRSHLWASKLMPGNEALHRYPKARSARLGRLPAIENKHTHTSPSKEYELPTWFHKLTIFNILLGHIYTYTSVHAPTVWINQNITMINTYINHTYIIYIITHIFVTQNGDHDLCPLLPLACSGICADGKPPPHRTSEMNANDHNDASWFHEIKWSSPLLALFRLYQTWIVNTNPSPSNLKLEDARTTKEATHRVRIARVVRVSRLMRCNCFAPLPGTAWNIGFGGHILSRWRHQHQKA